MPALTGAWFADRARGQGRLVVTNVAGAAQPASPSPLSPVVGPSGVPSPAPTGPSLPPGGTTPLPAPGTPLPGTPILTVGMTGVGFTGSVLLNNFVPKSGLVSGASFSCWVDYNPLLSSSFTPDLDYGALLFTDGTSTTGCQWIVAPTFVTMGQLETSTYADLVIGGTHQTGVLTGASFPPHWCHFMCSVEAIGTQTVSPYTSLMTIYRAIAYINDTKLLDTRIYTDPNYANTTVESLIDDTGTVAQNAGFTVGLTATSAGGVLDDPSISGYFAKANSPLRAGITEYWAYFGTAIDWTQEANRLKFHNTDGTIYIPCDLGNNGADPLGKPPTVYLTGDATDFLFNRATANEAVSAVGGSLIDVFDGFG